MDLLACLRIFISLLLFLSIHPLINLLLLAVSLFIEIVLAKRATARQDTSPSASSAGCSASSSYTHYNVFINYKVSDLRNTLALPLYLSLQSRGLKVFLDQREMMVGRNIRDQLGAAISVASVHIALLSPNYAESVFCLNELVLMVKSGAIIIPIFYDVNPSELLCTDKDKTGAYDKALLAHKNTHQYDNKTIQIWRDALFHIADISGLELKTFNGELLDKIVENVLNCFPNLPSTIAFE